MGRFTRNICVLCLFTSLGLASRIPTSAAESDRMIAHGFALNFGMVSAGNRACENLSLKKAADAKEIIEILSNTSIDSVRRTFQERRDTTEQWIRVNPTERCAILLMMFREYLTEMH